MQELNENLFWIINTDAGKAVDWLMIAVTTSGYSIVAVLLGLAAIWQYGGFNKKNVILFTAAVLLGGGAVHLIKQNLPLDRPLGYFAEKSPPMDDRVHAPFARPHHRTFPSGHSEAAFSVAAIVTLIFRRHVALWFIWAALVALSRVYLGVHFPADVVAGSLIGGLAAFIVFRAQHLFFTTEDTKNAKETD
ncbi:MAG: phosphatase PAP2 family protein [Nitrospinota bacterium]